MNMKKTTVKATLAGALGAAAVGLGAGIAQADPPFFPVPPVPGNSGISVDGPDVGVPGVDINGPDLNGPGVDINGPDVSTPGFGVDGPGVNVGGPGNPLPPGQGFSPPPGHDGFIRDVGAPDWAPPRPPSPPWAPFAPVQWNAEANAWGVYTNTGFQVVP
jgi:hypothetical protein